MIKLGSHRLQLGAEKEKIFVEVHSRLDIGVRYLGALARTSEFYRSDSVVSHPSLLEGGSPYHRLNCFILNISLLSSPARYSYMSLRLFIWQCGQGMSLSKMKYGPCVRISSHYDQFCKIESIFFSTNFSVYFPSFDE